MNATHSQNLRLLERRLKWLLALRASVRLMTVWLFLWGVTVLAARIAGLPHALWLAWGILGVVPIALIAAWHSHKRLPAFATLRARYDLLNRCGGVVMSEETADTAAWQDRLPSDHAPKLRWHSGRPMLLFSVSALFAGTALLIPERLANLSGHHTLEIGQIVEQLKTEVQVLGQDKILEDKKVEDLQKQLSQVEKDSSDSDPSKTWEALDHIKESNSQAAKQAAEEALAKTTALTQAETLAQAMQQAAEAGMSQANASQAARDLAGMLAAANLENGVLKGGISPEMAADLNHLSGADRERLQQLLSALQFNKNSLDHTVSDLAQLKLIDPSMLAHCRAAGTCTNGCSALAKYLSTCTNGCKAGQMCLLLGKGGPGGGGPPAPLTWKEGSSENDLKFQQHALPPATSLADAHLVGLSRSAPQVSDNTVEIQSGALMDAQGNGGSAHAQAILPEHRQAVQNFFKRDGQ